MTKERRDTLAVAVRKRKRDLEGELTALAFHISGRTETEDAHYVRGLQTAIAAAVEYGVRSLEEGQPAPMTIPPPLLVQARLAARSRVKVETVLRRYFSGYRAFAKAFTEEAERCSCTSSEQQEIIADLDRVFDALLTGVAAEYEDEIRRLSGAQGLRVRRIQQILDGEAFDDQDLGYPLEGYHVAMVATGRDVAGRLQQISSGLDRALLAVRISEDETWAWLGGRRSFSNREIDALTQDACPKGTLGALGEPAQGVSGWRLSHEQARAALVVAHQGSAVRYIHVALLVSAQKDPLLVRSLRELFIVPFEKRRDAGKAYKSVLRAYIDRECNVSAAAKAAGVSRRTVNNYVRIAEEQLGPITAVMSALDIALRLDESRAL